MSIVSAGLLVQPEMEDIDAVRTATPTAGVAFESYDAVNTSAHAVQRAG